MSVVRSMASEAQVSEDMGSKPELLGEKCRPFGGSKRPLFFCICVPSEEPAYIRPFKKTNDRGWKLLGFDS